jgi:hypothetical protein
VTAVAGNLYFFTASILAEVAAIFLAGLNVAIAGFVGALMFLVHVRLLLSMRGTRAPGQRREPITLPNVGLAQALLSRAPATGIDQKG